MTITTITTTKNETTATEVQLFIESSGLVSDSTVNVVALQGGAKVRTQVWCGEIEDVHAARRVCRNIMKIYAYELDNDAQCQFVGGLMIAATAV